jgi:DNA polymerase-3 subunit alpha
LNPDRISPPDVDLDFDYYRRDEIHNYFNEKYGIENCCHIGTYNTMKAKAVIRNVAKSLDVGGDWEEYELQKSKKPDLKPPKTFKKSLDIGDYIAKTIPEGDVKLEKVYKEEDEFRRQMIKYPKLHEISSRIEGTFSYGGKHASGLIVCRDKIKDHIALRKQGDVLVSEYDGPQVEDLGLLKFDILGLKTLTVVENTLKLIKDRHGIDIDIDNLVPDDKEVFKLFNGGYSNMDTRGIFQFESQFMDGILKNINVDRFEDLIVANALGRPGPAKAGVIDMYCDFKHGRKEIKYLHPKMGEALDQTYGLMVYQESVMKVSQILAGFTGAQADTLRKAMGKKLPEVMAKQRKLFVDGCINNGVSQEIANKVFEQIDFFSGYGFNKCLSGDTNVLNKVDGKTYTLKELNDDSYGIGGNTKVVLDSYLDGGIVDDELVEVFETGEKEIYEIELENGIIIKCTLDHKFYCSDGKPHTVQDILDNDLEIIYED